jgi:hypothetical protein
LAISGLAETQRRDRSADHHKNGQNDEDVDTHDQFSLVDLRPRRFAFLNQMPPGRELDAKAR